MAGSKQKHDMRLQLAAVAATHAIGWRGGTEQDGHFAILRLDYARTPTLPLLSPMVLCSRRCRWLHSGATSAPMGFLRLWRHA